MAVSPSKSKVYFHYEKRGFAFRNRNKTKKLLEKIFRREGKSLLALNYIFTSDRRILEINRAFLNHDYYTDIITFDLSETDATSGEIYISVDTVLSNSLKFHTRFNRELLRVIIHGALHLVGYSDKSARSKRLMISKEDEYLELIK